MRWPVLLLGCGLESCAATAVTAVQPDAAAPVQLAREHAVREIEPDQDVHWFTLATSVEGRPIRAATIGHGPRRVLWVGGIHGDEREGARATAELPATFLAMAGAKESVTLYLIQDLNPDGSAKKTRGNGRGVDLNRNFPAGSFRAGGRHGREALSEPESLALAELVAGWRPDVVIVAHSFRGAEFVNFDGPGREVAERFALESGFEVRGSEELEETPGSFGTWAGKELGVVVITIEYRRGRAPGEAWQETREAILAVIAG